MVTVTPEYKYKTPPKTALLYMNSQLYMLILLKEYDERQPPSEAEFLEKCEESIVTETPKSEYSTPPLLAELFVKVAFVMESVDLNEAEITPPYNLTVFPMKLQFTNDASDM
jgi:hypothetical protein